LINEASLFLKHFLLISCRHRYSTHPEVCIPGKERYAYGEPFADKAKRLIIPLLALPSLEVVQSLVLLTHQEFATDRDSALWMYAGMAIRMAQDIGLEKEPLPVRNTDAEKRNSSDADEGDHYLVETLPTYKTEREREIRRRVFWTVYFMDRLNSIGLGRRFVMWESSISTALPSYNPELDEMLTLPKDYSDNQEEDHLPLPYRYVAQMMQINATVSTTLNFCEEKDLRLAQLGEALIKLQAFNESIPSSFAFTVQNFQVYSERSQAGGFLLVHFWIHALIILVNCPTFLSTNLNSKLPNLGNWDQAYTSAKAISDFLSYVDLLNCSAYLANPFINQCIYVAACVLVKKIQDRLSNECQLEVYNTLPFNERLDVSSDQASYEICRKALLRMQTYWLGMNWTNVSLEQFSRGVLDVDLCTNDNNENYNEGNIPLLDNGLLRKLREKEISEAEHNGAGEAAKHKYSAQNPASTKSEKKSHPPINVFSTADDKELLKVQTTHPEASVGQTMDIFSDNYSIEEVVLSDVAFGDALSVGNESLLELISNSNTCNDFI
jgi:Fungal specific transcription factor domain